MEKLPSAEDIEGSGLYPIRTVSDLTGVNAITLRAWERRYGFFEPLRKASGHRLYTQKHIDLITRVVGLLEHGMRIGQVKAKLDAEDALAEKDHSGIGDRWSRYLERMTTAVIQFDESGLEAIYCEALSLYSVHEVTDHLITPLLKELGRRWEEGHRQGESSDFGDSVPPGVRDLAGGLVDRCDAMLALGTSLEVGT